MRPGGVGDLTVVDGDRTRATVRSRRAVARARRAVDHGVDVTEARALECLFGRSTAAAADVGLRPLHDDVDLAGLRAGWWRPRPPLRRAVAGWRKLRPQVLFRVELPLALPTIMAGIRVATVSAVASTTVGAILDYGGLGDLLIAGKQSDFKAQVLVTSALCVLLAVVLDLLLVALQRALTPWTRTAVTA